MLKKLLNYGVFTPVKSTAGAVNPAAIIPVKDTILPAGEPPSQEVSAASTRYDLFVILAILALVGGLLGVIWVIYKFMKEDQARWKQVSTEILKHRTQFDQLSHQMRQVMDEQKNADHEWTEEIRRLIGGRGGEPHGESIGSVSVASRPVKQQNVSSRPTVVLEPGTLRLTPLIMTENDMDRVLANELRELEPSNRIEEISIDPPNPSADSPIKPSNEDIESIPFPEEETTITTPTPQQTV